MVGGNNGGNHEVWELYFYLLDCLKENSQALWRSWYKRVRKNSSKEGKERGRKGGEKEAEKGGKKISFLRDLLS